MDDKELNTKSAYSGGETEKLKSVIIKIFFAYVVIVTDFRMAGMERMASRFIDRRFFGIRGVNLGDGIRGNRRRL
ncbi:MAG: hypothetical protein LBU26_03955 [Synergistaceae bacterium]|jgi:hypothetical protein|nr:hypothetical protein [Synergistaceae bacterium]